MSDSSDAPAPGAQRWFKDKDICHLDNGRIFHKGPKHWQAILEINRKPEVVENCDFKEDASEVLKRLADSPRKLQFCLKYFELQEKYNIAGDCTPGYDPDEAAHALLLQLSNEETVGAAVVAGADKELQDKAARLEDEASELRGKISRLQDKQDGSKAGKSMVGSFIGIATNYMQSLQGKSSSCTTMLAPTTVTKTPSTTTNQQTETAPPSTNLHSLENKASSCNTKPPHPATTTKKVLGDSNTYQQQAHPTTTSKKVPMPSTTTNQHAETTEATTSNPAEAVDAAVRAACKGRSHAFKSGLVEAVRAGARQQLAQAHTTYKANDPTSKLASCADMKARACSWLIKKALP